MLDRKFVVENIDAVRENCKNRGMEVDLDKLIELEALRREKIPLIEDKKREQKEVSKSIGKAKDDAEREERKEQGRLLREEVAALEKELAEIEEALECLMEAVPNMAHPDAPIGKDDKANLEIKKGKTPIPEFDFKPLDHVDLGEKLGIIDLEAGVRVAGSGFYFLRGDAVLLELALQQFAVHELIKRGFSPTITPDLATTEVVSGTGYIPRGPETQIYNIENKDLSLIATAEITLGGSLADQILDPDKLPIKVCGISHCFRTEAGAYGRATRGIYRVHQFTKVEMFAFTLPEQSDAMHDEILEIECDLFDQLGIPYRVVDTATGDLGGPAYRKFDIEAWMPGRGDSGEYGEVTSTSNCTDYQARRLKTRFKRKGEKGTTFVHTLNGTAVAISRAMIAILENYQQADGSVKVPEVLQKWVGKEVIQVPADE